MDRAKIEMIQTETEGKKKKKKRMGKNSIGDMKDNKTWSNT